MKKLSMFAMLAVLVLGLAAAAQAADIKVSGKWQIEAQSRTNWDYTGHDEENRFWIEQRMRTAFHFIANENLKAVLDTQIGSTNWGQGVYSVGAGRSAATTGGAASAGAGNIMLRQGYIDFKLPGTQIQTKAGFQTVSLPAAFGGGSAIFDNQVASLVVSSPIMDGLAVTAGYMRALESATNSPASSSSYDAVFAALPITPKGFNITPFAAFAYVGAGSGGLATGTNGFATANSSAANGVRAYWGGVSFTMDAFSPFKVMSDFNYGKATYNNNTTGPKGGRSGWLFDLAVDYTGLSMMTPSAFFVYTSGEKDPGSNGSQAIHGGGGRMPVIANPQTWTVGSFFFGDKDFITRGNTAADSTHENLGFWALGLSLKDIKLIDKVSHTATVMYAKGTNHKNYVINRNNGAVYGAMLTTKDSIWEVDFNTKYQMYNELALLLDLGYVNASFDKDVWRNVSARYNTDAKDAYKAAVSLTYAF